MAAGEVRILSGRKVLLIFGILYLKLLFYLFKKLKKPTLVRGAYRSIYASLAVYRLENSFHKLVAHEGRYFLSCNLPGFPNPLLFDKLLAITSAAAEVSTLDNIGMVQVAFTKKCPLNCTHCYEGKVLNQPEGISLEEHLQIIQQLQEFRVPVIQFGGGEPLNRYEDLLTVLRSSQKSTDFWIYSSGYGLTQEKALELKNSGLTGVSISLDHFEADAHNAFRRNTKSYDWAITAVQNAKSAELLVTLSICVTNEFCSPENLLSYYKLAKNLGVHFVQILEPRAVGNYEGQNVTLSSENIATLEAFFIEVVTSAKYKNFPIVQYYGYQQRRAGCVGAAQRYIYIDTDGCIQACPFCSNKKIHFLHGDHHKVLSAIKAEGCAY